MPSLREIMFIFKIWEVQRALQQEDTCEHDGEGTND